MQRFLPALAATFQGQLPATEDTVLDISADAGKTHATNKKINVVAVAMLSMVFKNKSITVD